MYTVVTFELKILETPSENQTNQINHGDPEDDPEDHNVLSLLPRTGPVQWRSNLGGREPFFLQSLHLVKNTDLGGMIMTGQRKPLPVTRVRVSFFKGHQPLTTSF